MSFQYFMSKALLRKTSTSDSVRSMRLLFSSVRFSEERFSSSPSPSSLKTLTSSVLPRSSPPLPEEMCGIVTLNLTALRTPSHHQIQVFFACSHVSVEAQHILSHCHFTLVLLGRPNSKIEHNNKHKI